MLIMFRANNFTSFEDEVILDLRATSYNQHPTHVVKDDQFKLLKTVAIYGANASGKSNLISALYFYERYIFSHLFQNNKVDQMEEVPDNGINHIGIEPFLLSSTEDRTIEFEMIFTHKNTLFQYGFSFEDSIVKTEWLLVNQELVFDRTAPQAVEHGKKFSSELKAFKKFREDRLYLSVLDYFATDTIKNHINNFKDFFESKYNVYFELFLESSVKGTAGTVSLSRRLVENESFRKKVANYINQIDVGIIDLVVENELMSSKSGEVQERPIIKTVHEIYNSEGILVGTKLFNLKQESTGTLRFLSFIQNILQMLEEGGVFIIDELSARLHPLLTKFIIDMFQSKDNTSHAQLIFTTHDTSILNNLQFRRDEVLFVDKNNRGQSRLYALSDLKSIRQDATYNKDYFNGKYGAIPIIKQTTKTNGGGQDGKTESVY